MAADEIGVKVEGDAEPGAGSSIWSDSGDEGGDPANGVTDPEAVDEVIAGDAATNDGATDADRRS